MAKPYLDETMQNYSPDLDIVKIFYGIHYTMTPFHDLNPLSYLSS